MPEKPHTENIQAKHDFTPAELQQLADNLTAAMERRADLDGQLASIKSDYKGKLESVESEMLRLASKHRSRFEMRDTLAIVAFSTPKPGRKSFYFAVQNGEPGSYIPGDFIREEEMTHADLQRTLPLEDAATGITSVTIRHGDTELYSAAPSKEVPPRGFAVVTEGDACAGDLAWIYSEEGSDGRWEAMLEMNIGLPVHRFLAVARPLPGAGTTPFEKALEAATGAKVVDATPDKKPRKKREPVVQPPGIVSVAGKEEHYLVLDLKGVETVAGITPLFRAAAKKAKWSDESVASILSFGADNPESLKAALAHYTYQHGRDL